MNLRRAWIAFTPPIETLKNLKQSFIDQKEGYDEASPSLVLSKIRLLESNEDYKGAYELTSSG